ncbi:hypothetical protein SMICM17S_00276 [Streptomyces microflavus]
MRHRPRVFRDPAEHRHGIGLVRAGAQDCEL